MSLTPVEAVNEFFAPAQFFDMDDGKKLSSAGFEPYQAGYLFATAPTRERRRGSSAVTFMPQLVTWRINGDDTEPQTANLRRTTSKVAAANARSAVAKGGVTLAGTRRFVDPRFHAGVHREAADVRHLKQHDADQVDGAPAAAARSATLIALDALPRPERRAGGERPGVGVPRVGVSHG